MVSTRAVCVVCVCVCVFVCVSHQLAIAASLSAGRRCCCHAQRWTLRTPSARRTAVLPAAVSVGDRRHAAAHFHLRATRSCAHLQKALDAADTASRSLHHAEGIAKRQAGSSVFVQPKNAAAEMPRRHRPSCQPEKTKAQGVCSEPRSPTKSPRAFGSSNEHSMRMGGIQTAPLTNPLALGGGRSALNCAPRHYH